MKLIYEKNGINIGGDCPYKPMWALDDILGQSGLVISFKEKIKADIRRRNKNVSLEFTFNNDSVLKVIDDSHFLIYNIEFEDDLDYRLIVPQQAFWDLLDEYSKIINTNWKKITIDFDGKKFDLSVEY